MSESEFYELDEAGQHFLEVKSGAFELYDYTPEVEQEFQDSNVQRLLAQLPADDEELTIAVTEFRDAHEQLSMLLKVLRVKKR